MKHFFTLSLFTLLFYTSYAQHYECFQPATRNFFTNDNGYLRGIRIDSVKASGDTTFYYPYHTVRGNYNSQPYQPVLDSTGGSWLGKKVIALSNGTWWFDNIWHDTCTIQTYASVGDNWIFFNDTTTRYYMAQMQTVDTMTVLGALDSIKTIFITAWDVAGHVTDDPVDSFEIKLSKAHGFVQVFDLYTFPYHKPDTAYDINNGSGFDYYTDEVMQTHIHHPYSIIYLPILNPTMSEVQIFKLIDFDYPTKKQMYNWNIGDAYEFGQCWAAYADEPYETTFDSIFQKNDLIGHADYVDSEVHTTISDTTHILANYTYDSTYFTDKMPEEYQQESIFYYRPNDTSYCITTPWLALNNNDIIGTMYFMPFEGPFRSIFYKIGLGLVRDYNLEIGPQYDDNILTYYQRDGQICGGRVNLSTPSTLKTKNIQVYPNPANEYLELSCTDATLHYSYTLYNMLGQNVRSKESNNGETSVSVQNLPEGVYNLTITENGNKVMNEKIVVQH